MKASFNTGVAVRADHTPLTGAVEVVCCLAHVFFCFSFLEFMNNCSIHFMSKLCSVFVGACLGAHWVHFACNGRLVSAVGQHVVCKIPHFDF